MNPKDAGLVTKDAGLAAALALHGHVPTTVSIVNGRTFFEFSGDATALQELQQAYYTGRLTGDLRAFNQSVRDLLQLGKAVRRG